MGLLGKTATGQTSAASWASGQAWIWEYWAFGLKIHHANFTTSKINFVQLLINEPLLDF